MPKKKSKTQKKPREQVRDPVYQLKISLKHIKPPVWRRVLVPAGWTLGSLHDIIQITFAWDNSHLNMFDLDGQKFTVTDGPEAAEDYALGIEDADEAPLDLLDLRPGDKFTYTYDFGDNWEHVVEVEKIVEADSSQTYPYCLKGARAAPPEDCGGPFGYEELLEAQADPQHPDHEEALEWTGGPIDREAFNLDAVNKQLWAGAHLIAPTPKLSDELRKAIEEQAPGLIGADSDTEVTVSLTPSDQGLLAGFAAVRSISGEEWLPLLEFDREVRVSLPLYIWAELGSILISVAEHLDDEIVADRLRSLSTEQIYEGVREAVGKSK
jgi:hypothetical protein